MSVALIWVVQSLVQWGQHRAEKSTATRYDASGPDDAILVELPFSLLHELRDSLVFCLDVMSSCRDSPEALYPDHDDIEIAFGADAPAARVKFRNVRVFDETRQCGFTISWNAARCYIWSRVHALGSSAH